MPYAIAVLLLVILGTGYTLLQNSADSAPLVVENTLTEAIASTTKTTVYNGDDEDIEEVEDSKSDDGDDNKDAPDDNPSASDIREQATTPVAPNPSPAPAAAADSNTYKNGTYRTQNSYRTPDGTYQMNVSVTVSDDTITSTSLSFDSEGARDGYSKRFNSSYQNQVIGQDLEGLSLSRVGGASLTTKAFNSALNTIRSQAS